MIWPKRKRKKPTPEQVDALRAKVYAELQMRQAQAQRDKAISLIDALHEIRRVNHVGEALEHLYQKGSA